MANKQKFIDAWLEHEDFKGWLAKVSHDPYLARCTVCGVTLKCVRSDLQKHCNGKKHLDNFRHSKTQQSLKNSLSFDSEIKKAEVKICAFIAEMNLLLAVDKLVPLLKSMPSKSVIDKVNLGKQKATNIIRHGMAQYYSDDLSETLRCNSFPLFVDETTDKSVIKQLAAMVVYCSEELEVKVDFLGIASCPDGAAVAVYEKLMALLRSKNVPLENMIGMCMDTTNVMVGQNNSLAQQVRLHFPWVKIIKCSCHLLALVSSNACKKLSNSLEDLCRTIHNHFRKSSKRTESLKEFQSFLNLKLHKMLRLGQTRWLSLHQCIRRILEHWEALALYWTSQVFEDQTHANQLTWDTLKNPLMKCLMEFADYALGLLNEVNAILQSNSPMLHLLQEKIETLIKTFAQNFMKCSYVRSTEASKINPLNEDAYTDVENIYIGIRANATLQTVRHKADHEQILKIYHSARAFYIEAIEQLKSRFSFEDEIYRDIRLIYPHNAGNLEPASIAAIGVKYARPSWDLNLDQLEEEWRSQSLENASVDLEVVPYWQHIFSLKTGRDEKKYKELPKLVKFFLALPFSNALVERLFSDLKNIKTDNRTCPSNNTLSGLLHVKHGLKRKRETSADIDVNAKLMKYVSKVKANASSAVTEIQE